MLLAYAILCVALQLMNAGFVLSNGEKSAGCQTAVGVAAALFGISAIINHYVGLV